MLVSRVQLTRFVVVAALLCALAACATTPPADLTPPPRKPLDAKTQLETGRRY
jgi:hypothetical protein